MTRYMIQMLIQIIRGIVSFLIILLTTIIAYAHLIGIYNEDLHGGMGGGDGTDA
jgi:hypothetical protein